MSKKRGEDEKSASPFARLASLRGSLPDAKKPAGTPAAPATPKKKSFAEQFDERRGAARAPAKETPAEVVKKTEERTLADRQALHDAFLGVAPIGDKRRAVPGEPVRRGVKPDLRDADAEARARLASLVSGGVRFDVERDEAGRVTVLRVGADRTLLRRLLRGDLAIDGVLDLHGMHAEDAEVAVVKFVRRHAKAGARAVRVIHGKGLHSEGGVAVLADVVLRTLTEGAAAPVVRAVATAAEADGGTGALDVALGSAR